MNTLIILTAMTLAQSAEDVLEDTADLIDRSLRELKREGIRYDYEQEIAFLPEGDVTRLIRITGTDTYYGETFLLEHQKSSEVAGQDTRVTTSWDGGEYRILWDRRAAIEALADLPPPAPFKKSPEVVPLEGRVSRTPPEKPVKPVLWRHPIDCEAIVSPEGFLSRWVRYPKESEDYRRQHGLMPPVLHSATRANGTITITTEFSDPTMVVRLDGSGLSAKRVVVLSDAMGGLPTSCEFWANGELHCMAPRLIWSSFETSTGLAWLLTLAEFDFSIGAEPGDAILSTFSINLDSVQVGTPDPGSLSLEFPSGTHVYDEMTGDDYLAVSTPIGQDHVDRTYESLVSTIRENAPEQVPFHDPVTHPSESSRAGVGPAAEAPTPRFLIGSLAVGGLIIAGSTLYSVVLWCRARSRLPQL